MERINRIIRMYLDAERITTRELAEITGRDQSTVRRWSRGQCVPPDARRALAEQQRCPAMANDVRDSEYVPAPPLTNLDVNGDGRVDIDDMLDAESQRMQLIGDDALQTRRDLADGEFDEDERIAKVSRTNSILGMNRIIAGIASAISAPPRRRKAKPFANARRAAL